MNKDKPLSEEDFNSIYAKVPRLTVELIFHIPQGVLLTKRNIEPCKGQWHIPGGTVYFGETMHMAIKRVALDELGVTVTPKRLLGYIEYPSVHAQGYKGWPIGVAFEVEPQSGKFRGSPQGEIIEFFKEVPQNIISEQATFLTHYFTDKVKV